ncbi:excisionase family DNA-binding protein (plasmid) [Cronobacter sakazakii]
MAKVSISEAARLVNVSRPTLYKMLSTGKLTYTSVVKHGKQVKTIDTSELMRVFGSMEGVKDDTTKDVKFDDMVTEVNTDALQVLQHQIALLKTENEGLKGAVNIHLGGNSGSRLSTT